MSSLISRGLTWARGDGRTSSPSGVPGEYSRYGRRNRVLVSIGQTGSPHTVG